MRECSHEFRPRAKEIQKGPKPTDVGQDFIGVSVVAVVNSVSPLSTSYSGIERPELAWFDKGRMYRNSRQFMIR
jgi:hypothetical protein